MWRATILIIPRSISRVIISAAGRTARARSPSKLRLSSLFVAALALLAACGQAPPVQKPAPPPDPSIIAANRLRSGNYSGAAQAYAALAETPQSAYRILAALLFYDLGDLASAQTHTPPAVPVSPSQAQLYNLLAAATATDLQDYERARTHLAAIDPHQLDDYPRGLYWRVHGALASASFDHLAALAAFFAAESTPLPVPKQALLTQNIWNALGRVDATELASLAASSPNGKGWRALLEVYRTPTIDAAQMTTALEHWRSRYPQHPAARHLLDGVLAHIQQLTTPPRQVALLLPFEGPYASAAEAVRDGFLTAWFNDTTGGDARPAVMSYFANTDNVQAVLAQALSDGADFIVGPLERGGVERLASLPELDVPILALNVTTTPTTPSGLRRIFQFALSPEDEAAEAARHAYTRGARRAVVMTPQSEWGERLSAAFGSAWETLGGTVVDYVRIEAGVSGYPTAVRTAIGVKQSEQRAAALRQLLQRRLAFVPRRRTDVDALLLAIDPVAARQLLPQIHFFDAQDIPIFATSHVFAGARNPREDRDLDGLQFVDMPWVLDPDRARSERAVINRYWAARNSQLGHLYAFGIDAYHLLGALVQMQLDPRNRFAGASGELWLDSSTDRIRRELHLARFERGVPVREP